MEFLKERPVYAEYGIFDLASAKPLRVYSGYEFATSPRKGEVAYIADPEQANPEELQVQVNGTTKTFASDLPAQAWNLQESVKELVRRLGGESGNLWIPEQR